MITDMIDNPKKTTNNNAFKVRVYAGYLFIVVLLSLWVYYILGGIVFAYNTDAIYNRRILLILFAASLALVITPLCILGRYYKLDEYIYQFYRSFSIRKVCREYMERYKICTIDMVVLTIIVLAGGYMRLIGYNWGRVASWQPDERKLTDASIIMNLIHRPYLDDVYYPNQFLSKAVAVIVCFCSKICNLTLDESGSVWVIFVFRIVVALCGMITIFVAFLIGNYFIDHLGCVFALLVALYPYYINLASQVTCDVTTLMFLSLLMLFSLRYMEERKTRFLCLMTMCAAMATLEKWHGAIGLGFIGVLLLFQSDGVIDYIKKGFATIGMYLLWMAAFAPNIMAKPVKTIEDGFINIAVYDRAERSAYSSVLKEYLRYGYEYVFGISGLVLLAIGIVYLVRTFNRKYLIFLLGPLKIMCLGFLNRDFPRWGFEFYFSELFVISLGLFACLFRCKIAQRSVRVPVTILAAACGIVMLASMSAASGLAVLVSASNDNDSRLIQRDDCRRLGIGPDDITSQYYSGFSPASHCDSEYPDHNVIVNLEWTEFLHNDNGRLYRTELQPDYVCLCPSHYEEDDRIKNLLDENGCKLIRKYDTVCTDVFRIPFRHGKQTNNDIEMISSNITVIKQIVN